MIRLIREIVRPYRGTLAVILLAMLVETIMSLAGPWPLKVILDNVVGSRHLPRWLDQFVGPSSAFTHDKMHIAVLAALAAVLIAVISSLASYVDNYYTTNVGQWVAHDLRMRTFHHLQRLSLGYYDTHRTGILLSTITDDIQTIQSFASSSTLGILVDLFTIVGMLGLMFWMNWEFALVALGVTPFLLLFVSRFKRAVKKATHEVRHRQSDIVTAVQQDLESVRVVKAFGRQDLEQKELEQASLGTVNAALKARKVKSLLTPIVAITVALCTSYMLWRGASLIFAGVMTVGALTVFLAYLNNFSSQDYNAHTLAFTRDDFQRLGFDDADFTRVGPPMPALTRDSFYFTAALPQKVNAP